MKHAPVGDYHGIKKSLEINSRARSNVSYCISHGLLPSKAKSHDLGSLCLSINQS
jgi:hypothetical protein